MRSLRIISGVMTLAAFTFLAGCGGGSSTPSVNAPANPIASSGNNVAGITVNGGPLGNYADAAFVTVTVCVPGTSTCQAVDNVLVDTGSSGLRILSSALSLTLPQVNASGSDPLVECYPFVSGYTWGPVKTADVEMASEKASSVPIQVLSDSDYTAPASCTDYGESSDSVESLGANGIVGVGLFTLDCGIPSSPSCPSVGDVYYDCASTTSCSPTSATSAQQVPNPVSLFTTDNNGVIVELPSISGGEESTASGSLVFGIGTESNNELSGASIYTANEYGEFTTSFNNTTYSSSFIDSGSNGYYFSDASIAQCGNNSEAPGFYCPSSTDSLSATNEGLNGTSGTVDFSIADAITLFNSDDNAFSDLGGTSAVSGGFDWGLPFFFGRNVYTGIQNGTYATGYWAY